MAGNDQPGATPPETAESPRLRRRLEGGRQERVEGRSGCLAMGAVLGVIAGIMVGLYALPPILKSIYGVESVSAVDAYTGEGKHLRVISVQSQPGMEGSPDSVVVTLSVLTDQRWEIDATKWRLELDDGTRLEGLIAAPAPPVFEVDRPGHLVLRFPLLPSLEPRAAYLHLSSPRVRFELGDPGP